MGLGKTIQAMAFLGHLAEVPYNLVSQCCYVILGVKTSMGAKWPRGCLLLLVHDQHILKEVWHWIFRRRTFGDHSW
jgi:hypothetical protein